MTDAKVIDVLDYATALKFVKKAVDTAPTRVYEQDEENGCAYVHTTAGRGVDYVYTPGCLIGHALIDMGVPMETFIDRDINIMTAAADAVGVLVDEGFIGSITNKARDFLSRAQAQQDDGFKWSEALGDATRYVAGGMYDDNE